MSEVRAQAESYNLDHSVADLQKCLGLVCFQITGQLWKAVVNCVLFNSRKLGTLVTDLTRFASKLMIFFRTLSDLTNETTLHPSDARSCCALADMPLPSHVGWEIPLLDLPLGGR